MCIGGDTRCGLGAENRPGLEATLANIKGIGTSLLPKPNQTQFPRPIMHVYGEEMLEEVNLSRKRVSVAPAAEMLAGPRLSEPSQVCSPFLLEVWRGGRRGTKAVMV